MNKAVFVLAVVLGVGCALAADTLCPTYTIKSGDGLFQIVEANNKSFTQDELIATLKQFINYTDQTILQVNQVIPLPGYAMGCQFVITTEPAFCKAYQVQQNDTIAGIAQSLGLTEDDIAVLNGDNNPADGKPDVGSYLRLPGWDSKKCLDPKDTVTPCQVYIVKQGDSISQLAALYKLDAAELMKLNGLTDKSSLVLNQQLKFPPWGTECEIPANQKPARLPSDTAKTCRVAQLQTGQGLYDLGAAYGKTPADLEAVNSNLADDTILKLGAVINIDSICDCTNVVLVGNGTLPASYVMDKAYCNKAEAAAPAPAAVMADVAPAPAPMAMAPAPAPREMIDAPAPAVSTVVVPTAPAPEVAVSTVSGATGVAPSLMLLLAMVAGVVALF